MIPEQYSKLNKKKNTKLRYKYYRTKHTKHIYLAKDMLYFKKEIYIAN